MSTDDGAEAQGADTPSIDDAVDTTQEKPVQRMPGDLRRQDVQQDIELKRDYGRWALIAMGGQLVIADCVFVGYGFGVAWQIPPNVIIGWLGATVIQVIAVVLVITRYLFPPRTP